MKEVVSYLHNVNSGDLIGALAGIREIYRKKGKKAIIYQVLDHPGLYAPGVVHSVRDAHGTQVTMNKKMFDMLHPLLISLPYVEDFKIHRGEKVDIDLTYIRETYEADEKGKVLFVHPPKINVNIPYMALPGWHMLAFPHMACDLSEPWIDIHSGEGTEASDMIVVNRTERYTNPDADYSFLKDYEKEVVFTGTQEEYGRFCKEFGLTIPYLEITDFLDLAHVLRHCRFFIGNQSFPWNLANAMGVPRILEMSKIAPNCQPFYGKDNYGFAYQVCFRYFFDHLYKKKAAPQEQLSL